MVLAAQARRWPSPRPGVRSCQVLAVVAGMWAYAKTAMP